MYKEKTISVVIPCYDESPRIQNVIKPILRSKHLDEVIVVDDGSNDNTVAKVLEFDGKVKLIRHKVNFGKAAAVFDGIKASKSDVIFMIDADLVGLRPVHIDYSIEQFIEKDLDMLLMPVSCQKSANSFSKFTDFIGTLVGADIVATGERLLKREKVLPFTHKRKIGYGLEMYLNKIAKRKNWKIDVILWKKGSTVPEQTLKVEKYGFVNGLKKEVKMFFTEMFKEADLIDYITDFKYMVKKVRK